MSKPKRAFLFLDIDGVLNSDRWMSRAEYATTPWPMRDVNPICCARLIEAVKGLPVDIVLSSSWRKFPHAKQWVEFCGIKLFDQTPLPEKNHRGLEIEKYFTVTPFKDRPYIILDDDTDFLQHQLPFLVRTDVYQGLTFRKAQELRRRLEGVTCE